MSLRRHIHKNLSGYARMKALIVDDNPTNALFMRRLVEKIDGCEAVAFTDPVAVAEQLEELEFDIALIDFVMPGMDGLELVREIRSHFKHLLVPIIMISGADERALRIDCIEGGVNDFLLKPIDPIELKARVRNLFALYSAQRSLEARGDELQAAVDQAMRKIVAREEEIVLRLARATESRDTDTGNHIVRMSTVCRIIAEDLGFDREFCRSIQVAAQMHDIGKVHIPDNILFKPGPLTPEERAIMETHTTIGEEILAGSDSLLIQTAAKIAGSHHEKWDGTGYPRRLAGTDIPITGRIAAVADVFDALVSPRPYKKPWAISEARDYIAKESGRQFDPGCVAAFLRRFDVIAPIGERAQMPEEDRHDALAKRSDAAAPSEPLRVAS